MNEVTQADIERVFDDGNEHRVRTARKAGRCQYGRGAEHGGLCRNIIQPGDRYADGEMDDWNAGGYARERWCMECMVHMIAQHDTPSAAEGEKR